jgi:hypothetical protein
MIRTSLKFTSRNVRSRQSNGAEPQSRLTDVRSASAGVRTAPTRSCDYEAPAGLFVREASRLRYRPFDRVALAVQHANESLTHRQLLSCTMEVDDRRFDADDIRRLYFAPGYPFVRRAGAGE